MRRPRLRQDAAWHHLSGQRRRAVRRAGRPDEFRGKRRRTGRGRRLAGFRLEALVGSASCSSTTCTSNAARSRRPASTTSKVCSSASITPSSRSAPSASCSTRSSRCSAALQNETILRAELRRLFRWLRDHNLTVVITGEKGEETLTRHGLEEYVTDAVIFARPSRGRAGLHAADSGREVPRLPPRHERISVPDRRDGLSVLPVTSLTLQHMGVNERVSSGLPPARRDAGRPGLLIAAARC